MDALLHKKLLNKSGELVEAEAALKNMSTVVYYFSAAWCGPCKLLLPIINRIHEESRKRNIPLEIIYVSSDLDEEVFKSHFMQKQGDWYAVPYDDPLAEELRYRYTITNIPNIVVVKNDGTVITANGRKEVEDIGVNVLVTWTE